VCWDFIRKGDKYTKPPINPQTGRNASVSKPKTWGTFAEALAGMEKFDLAGIGLVLTKDGGVSAVDLDNHISEDGPSPLATEVLGYAETYAEISPSGKGLRLFMSDPIANALKENGAGVEVYGSGRFMTVTAQRIPDAPDEVRSAPLTLARLTAVVEAVRQSPNNGKSAKNGRGTGSSDSSDFFKNVNRAALAELATWVPTLHPTAKFQQGTGGWRVTSRDLGRGLEEDLSYHSKGITDFGEENGLTPIDAVRRFGRAKDAVAAALWLCDQLRIEPASLGWRGAASATARDPAYTSPAAGAPPCPANEDAIAEVFADRHVDDLRYCKRLWMLDEMGRRSLETRSP
jgi:hypothetical protein